VQTPLEPTASFALVVRFDLPTSAAATAFDALVRDVVPGILSEEPGTLVYATHAVDGEPLARVFYEAYRDRSAHAAHEARPATARFLQQVGELGPVVRVDFLTPDGAVG
jgi:quinol monooxygenase YgiN